MDRPRSHSLALAVGILSAAAIPPAAREATKEAPVHKQKKRPSPIRVIGHDLPKLPSQKKDFGSNDTQLRRVQRAEEKRQRRAEKRKQINHASRSEG